MSLRVGWRLGVIFWPVGGCVCMYNLQPSFHHTVFVVTSQKL